MISQHPFLPEHAGPWGDRFDTGEYRPHPAPARGVKIRHVPGPLPPSPPPPPPGDSRDGNWDRILKGLPGLRRPAALSPDDRVPWSADLSRPTVRNVGGGRDW
jgi:hypothetical protein